MLNSFRHEVMKILREVPGSRSSDDILLMEFSKRHCKKALDLKDFGLCFGTLKTIERDRRWIQRYNEDLQANIKVKEDREDLELAYRREYAEA